jgi:TIGR00255 family protein
MEYAEIIFGQDTKEKSMIKSMTGFGRCEIAEADRKITVEMKSVNHRYLDVTIKMPKKLNFFEAAIRTELKNYMQRGKVDLFITYEDFTESNVCVKYNKELAAEYMQYFDRMAEDFSLDNDIRVSTLARFPEILTMEEQTVDEEQLWKLLDKALKGAAENFVETRIREGENLRNDLIAKLEGMLAHVDFITERSPEIIEEYKEKLTKKVEELLSDKQVDESRLLMEVTIFADKVCVDEELVRLRSHITATRDALLAGGSIGRKLDFIAQEMNREANTILSKSSDLEISNRAIELKTEIEKVREQIQNIE